MVIKPLIAFKSKARTDEKAKHIQFLKRSEDAELDIGVTAHRLTGQRCPSQTLDDFMTWEWMRDQPYFPIFLDENPRAFPLWAERRKKENALHKLVIRLFPFDRYC